VFWVSTESFIGTGRADAMLDEALEAVEVAVPEARVAVVVTWTRVDPTIVDPLTTLVTPTTLETTETTALCVCCDREAETLLCTALELACTTEEAMTCEVRLARYPFE
jgi:hypothetical protein